jgi:hypothetical protein
MRRAYLSANTTPARWRFLPLVAAYDCARLKWTAARFRNKPLALDRQRRWSRCRQRDGACLAVRGTDAIVRTQGDRFSRSGEGDRLHRGNGRRRPGSACLRRSCDQRLGRRRSVSVQSAMTCCPKRVSTRPVPTAPRVGKGCPAAPSAASSDACSFVEGHCAFGSARCSSWSTQAYICDTSCCVGAKGDRANPMDAAIAGREAVAAGRLANT